MASPVIRARVAPIALAVALAFVVVGFFRADREMIRAERESVSLMASGTATLVELFVLRQLSQLETVKRLVDDHGQDSIWLADALPALTTRTPQLGVQFDGLWLTGRSLQHVSSLDPWRTSLVDTMDLKTALETRSDTEQVLVVKGHQGRHLLLFVESIHGAPSAKIVGMVAVDSLTAFLQRQKRPRAVGILVRVSSDTIVTILPLVPNKQQRDLEQMVAIPAAGRWVVTMTYTPTGRGARIALWVVGLGAIVGLGIGLILERREASRIADRSSELEHLSTELLRANRAKSEFLANVSHELRTPLNAIVGFVDLLRDGVYGPLNSRQAGPVERIEASANHLRHLVDQVLDLAKMAAGRLEVHTEPVELRPFVFDVASEVEPLMTEKGLSFSLAVAASLPRIRTDPTHLRQILINLLGNAVKFTASGGISVRGKLVTRSNQGDAGNRLSASELLNSTARSESHWVALQVVDSGIGISEKDRERIFDEFEQVNAGPRGDSMRRGTGLGLSISRRLARLLGGDITVESEVGRGSVFTVWLPVDPADFRGGQAA
jgi:signal transduction histidine kinase